MEEKKVENKTEETISVKAVAIIALGAYLLGCVASTKSNVKNINEAYNKGVLDTVNRFIFNKQ